MENSRHTPDYIVYTITETGAEQKNFWQRVGAAWRNKDDSINVTLNALPLNGKLHLRAPKNGDDDK